VKLKRKKAGHDAIKLFSGVICAGLGAKLGRKSFIRLTPGGGFGAKLGDSKKTGKELKNGCH
jgi:hypothetical protein